MKKIIFQWGFSCKTCKNSYEFLAPQDKILARFPTLAENTSYCPDLRDGVGGHGSRVGHALVLDVGDVPAVAGVVGVVVDDLGAAVRKSHPVGASHGASVRVLVL